MLGSTSIIFAGVLLGLGWRSQEEILAMSATSSGLLSLVWGFVVIPPLTQLLLLSGLLLTLVMISSRWEQLTRQMRVTIEGVPPAYL